jgi:hypothetical protein
MYLQQAVSILNKPKFPVGCSHSTDLWLVQYDDNEKCLSQEARCFLSKHGRLQKNSVVRSCVNIALLSDVINGFTKNISLAFLSVVFPCMLIITQLLFQ